MCENAAQGSVPDSNASSSSGGGSSSSSASSSASGHRDGGATWRYESPDVDHSRTSSQSHSSSSRFYTSSSSVSSAFFDFLRHHADGASAARADTLKLEAQMLSAARSLQQRYVLSFQPFKRLILVDLMQLSDTTCASSGWMTLQHQNAHKKRRHRHLRTASIIFSNGWPLFSTSYITTPAILPPSPLCTPSSRSQPWTALPAACNFHTGML